jgi:flagellar hook-associated protein 2
LQNCVVLGRDEFKGHSMAENFMKTMNVGSGLDTKSIVDSLVSSQKTPKETAIKARLEDRNVKISAFGQVTASVKSLDTTLSDVDGSTGLALSNTGTAITATISDITKATEFSHQFEVSQLASAHTLVFDGYSSSSTALGAGSLVFEFGTWSDGTFTPDASAGSQTITISSNSDTLEDIAGEINDAAIGVTAKLVKTATSNYALSIQSSTGADNAMRITATETSSGSGLANLNYTSFANDVEAVSGADAQFTIDGVDVTRESNVVTDLIEGVTLTMLSTTSSADKIEASYDASSALSSLQSMVDGLNTLISTLKSESRRSQTGIEAGPLAGDPLVRSILEEIRGFTTDPITGFGDDAIYFADFGVKTNRDGTLSIDQDDFEDAFEANPANFSAIVSSRITSASSMVSGTVNGDNYTAGAYSFAISGGNATIDGAAMTLDGGKYHMTSGNAEGLKIEIDGSGANTTIYMGRSLVDQIKTFTEALLASSNDIDDRISQYSEDVSDYTLQLATLDEQMERTRERYLLQFAEMESAVASFKRTGEALTNMMEAWKNNK